MASMQTSTASLSGSRFMGFGGLAYGGQPERMPLLRKAKRTDLWGCAGVTAAMTGGVQFYGHRARDEVT